VLMVRSFLYITRILKESKEPTPAHLSHIIACQPERIQTIEDQMVYNYRTLGIECEK
jgi:hypothetical protein